MKLSTVLNKLGKIVGKDKFRLSTALNELGKIVGKDKYRSVEVTLTSYGKKPNQKEEIVSKWSVYYEGRGIFEGSTFDEAIKNLKESKSKRKFEDGEA